MSSYNLKEIKVRKVKGEYNYISKKFAGRHFGDSPTTLAGTFGRQLSIGNFTGSLGAPGSRLRIT